MEVFEVRRNTFDSMFVCFGHLNDFLLMQILLVILLCYYLNRNKRSWRDSPSCTGHNVGKRSMSTLHYLTGDRWCPLAILYDKGKTHIQFEEIIQDSYVSLNVFYMHKRKR